MPEADHFIARVPGIQYGVLDSLVGYAVRRAQIRVYETFTAALEPWRITPPRFSALVLVSLNPGLKLTQLAKIMGIARSGVVILVDALEDMGYVVRMPMPEDRRAFGLQVTDKGRHDLAAITQAVSAQDQAATRMLSAAEQATLRDLLTRLSDAAG